MPSSRVPESGSASARSGSGAAFGMALFSSTERGSQMHRARIRARGASECREPTAGARRQKTMSGAGLLWTQAFATLALVGLIWTIQLVHYPLMAEIRAGFATYHSEHCRRITWIVAPLMGLEAVCAGLLWLDRPPAISAAAAALGAALVGVNWVVTALVSVPLHNRLGGRQPDADVIGRLVTTNWIRTLAWTARGPLVLWMAAVAG